MMFGAILPKNPQKSSQHKTKTLQKDKMINPSTWRKKKALPIQSTGEKRKEETKLYPLGETIVPYIS
jgi:hypothetical protein